MSRRSLFFLWCLLGGVVIALGAGRWLRPSGTFEADAARKGSVSRSGVEAVAPDSFRTYGYDVLGSWPHDPGAFTQGLFFLGEELIESTGQYGQSELRRVAWRTGEVRQRIVVPRAFFAEGAAVLNGRIYQLTWRAGRGFIHDAATLAKLGEFTYAGEGWGLTTDGHRLIMSDGTARIRFLDPETFAVVRTIDVQHEGKAIPRLNELEFIAGEIFANVWQSDHVVRIDPATGRVCGVIDFRGLLRAEERGFAADVLNGIAYDPTADRLLVTGKYWPKLFEVRLVPRD